MTNTQTRKVACPTCAEQADWNKHNAYRPFCSRRCKLIDLGDWLSEKYAIASNDSDAESE